MTEVHCTRDRHSEDPVAVCTSRYCRRQYWDIHQPHTRISTLLLSITEQAWEERGGFAAQRSAHQLRRH